MSICISATPKTQVTSIFKLNGLKAVDNVIFNAHNTEPYQKQLDGLDMVFFVVLR